MATEKSVKLKNVRPGDYVAQPAKKVCRTEWTEDGITLFYDDGTNYPGGFEDGLTVVRTAAQEIEQAPEEQPGEPPAPEPEAL